MMAGYIVPLNNSMGQGQGQMLVPLVVNVGQQGVRHGSISLASPSREGVPMLMPQAAVQQPQVQQVHIPHQPVAVKVPTVPSIPPEDSPANVLKHLLNELSKGLPSVTAYLTSNVFIETASITPLSYIPYAGNYKGYKGAVAFFSAFREAFHFRRYEVTDIAVTGHTGYCKLHICSTVKRTNKRYEGTEVFVVEYAGSGKISKISLYSPAHALEDAFLEDGGGGDSDGSVCSAPPLLPEETPMKEVHKDMMHDMKEVKQVVRQRRVADTRPCGHNEWDNVRIKRGEIMLRCRLCQEQWRAPANTSRCTAFQQGNCNDRNCTLLHVHAHKQSLADRVSQFGDSVLLHVPMRQRLNSVTLRKTSSGSLQNPVSQPSTPHTHAEGNASISA